MESKNVLVCDGYSMNSYGKVFSNISGRVLKQIRNKKTQHYEVIINNKIYRIEELVASNYLPNPNNNKYIIHLNHKLSDNKVHNLKWVSLDEFIEHLNSIEEKKPKKIIDTSGLDDLEIEFLQALGKI